ncbi:MrcB family domain-containing protein [Acetobacterium sp. UBA5834]|uniref:MrcB family domain-containing protein n=1 Tax=Acetobacterium sp. UBA5834 TaxID=1945907 RepID=UPI00257D605A|nr:DUF3578 domain-containing protein [Acetobacterium sp. UBA5834]
MSWELTGSDQMIKMMELADFKSTEMLVPVEMIGFFGNVGDRLAIIYQNREYPAYLEAEGGNTILKWSKVLIRKLGETFPDYESWFQGEQPDVFIPRMELTKSNDAFSLSLITGASATASDAVKASDATQKTIPAGVGLRELLLKWIAGYPNYYPRDFRFSFKDIINEEIPKVIESLEAIQSGHYQVRGFAGDTQWAEIPWVKVVEKKDQRLDHEDLYLAYILAKDSGKLYLAIVYGKEGLGIRSLSEQAAKYREKIETENFKTSHQEVLLASASLVSGIVCYREYSETDMPEDGVLATEFEAFRKMYEQCLIKDRDADKTLVSNETIEKISTETDCGETIETVSASPIMEVEADPKTLVEAAKTVAEPQLTKTAAVVAKDLDANRSDEVIDSDDSLLCNAEDNREPQPVFPSPPPDKAMETETVAPCESRNPAETPFDQEAESAQNGQIISGKTQKICEKAEFEEDHAIASDANKATPVEMLTRPLVRYPAQNDELTPALRLVQAKMGNRGYYYPAELIKRYYLSIKSKPFVMIKGRVGSGKTSFPRLFAEAIGATSENSRFKRLLVGKNWDDDTHLFGRLDSRGHFIPGPIMLMLKAAKEYPDKPHFFLLDEMDRSPTAEYLRLLLEGINGSQEPFLKREDFGSDITAYREYGSLNFPDNLYFIATINEGLGYFPVPDRVIDSGNVIEMPVVEIGVFPDYGSPVGDSDWENSAFKIHSQAKGLPEILERLMNLLKDLQTLLIGHDCPMGYRGKNEILAFGINSGAEGLFTEEEIIDLAIVQRILPALALDPKADHVVYQELACFLLDDGLREKCLNLPLDRFIGHYEVLLKDQVIPCPRSGQAVVKLLKTK